MLYDPVELSEVLRSALAILWVTKQPELQCKNSETMLKTT